MLIYQIFLYFLALAFGSFANVLIYRVPKELSISSPASHCPACNHVLKWYENIPLFSILFLQGKCSNCHTKISWQYPLVELTVLLFALPFIKVSLTRTQMVYASTTDFFFNQSIIFSDLLFHLIVISGLVALSVIDSRQHKLPFSITYSLIIISLLYVSLYGSQYYEIDLSSGFDFLPSFLDSFFATLKQFGIIFLVFDCLTHLINKLYFKENALAVLPRSLTFGNVLLERNSLVYYSGLLVCACWFFSFSEKFWFEILSIFFGGSYLINEIIAFLFRSRSTVESIKTNQRTVFGGGDVALLAFFSILIGYEKTFGVLMAAFYVTFVLVLIKIIYKFFEWQIQARQQDNSFDLMGIIKSNVPLGAALSVSFIAVMMVLAK